MDNQSIAEVLEEIALLLELKGENAFKTRAYINGARALEKLDEPFEALIKRGEAKSVKGIGDALVKKITELVENGKLDYLENLKHEIPAGLIELTELSGLGPKKVRLLHQELKIESISQLKEACEAGKVSKLSGFGSKTQDKLLESIQFKEKYASFFRLDVAMSASGYVLDQLRMHPDSIRVSQAGSLRRRKEIVGDLDFLVSSNHPAQILSFFTKLSGVQSILSEGKTKASVIWENGIQLDLRVVSDEEFPFALAYFTGSKEHNVVMRRRATERGLRLNEYGLFPSATKTNDPSLKVQCQDEKAIFQKLGLNFIPPELREDQGEFEIAEKTKIPKLLEWEQMKGSLHNHSTYSDGKQTLEEIVETCEDVGCSYWAITDHSKSSFQANGLNEERLIQQIDDIGQINQKLSQSGQSFRLLTGSEVDIMSDGGLDFDDEILSQLDVVVASIHQGFTQSKKQLTHRFIKAAENPHVHMLGHLSGRLLLERKPYEIDHSAIIEACASTGTWIEFNASPYRLDMDWRFWREARDKGVKCVINCDAHQEHHISYLKLGAEVVRKGWLSSDDIVNTLSLDDLKMALGQKRKKWVTH